MSIPILQKACSRDSKSIRSNSENRNHYKDNNK